MTDYKQLCAEILQAWDDAPTPSDFVDTIGYGFFQKIRVTLAEELEMTENHPITPSEDVVDEWESEWHHYNGRDTYEVFMAKQASRWGADQELEACCQEVHDWYGNGGRLRDARRPKPPSLKVQALELVDRIEKAESVWAMSELDTIRRALEQLND